MNSDCSTGISFRKARPEDAAALAEICLMADPEVFRYLYGKLLAGDPGVRLVERLCATTDTTYSYEHFTLAVEESQVLGGFNAIPTARLGPLELSLENVLGERLKLPPWSMIRWLLRRTRLAARAEPIAVPENSFLIGNLSVFPEHRGRGVGRTLLDAAASMAEADGYRSLSLFVWEDRDEAVNLYLRNGFRYEHVGRFRKSRALPHTGRALMVRRLDPRPDGTS